MAGLFLSLFIVPGGLDLTAFYGVDESGQDPMFIVVCRSVNPSDALKTSVSQGKYRHTRHKGEFPYGNWNFGYTESYGTTCYRWEGRVTTICDLLQHYSTSVGQPIQPDDMIIIDAFYQGERLSDRVYEELKARGITVKKHNIICEPDSDRHYVVVHAADAIAAWARKFPAEAVHRQIIFEEAKQSENERIGVYDAA